jgi:hypothetical protein
MPRDDAALGNTWRDWARRILYQLEELNKEDEKLSGRITGLHTTDLPQMRRELLDAQKEIERKVSAVGTQVAKLKRSASMWALLGGMIPVLLQVLLIYRESLVQRVSQRPFAISAHAEARRLYGPPTPEQAARDSLAEAKQKWGWRP